ncbi:MAG: B12-binding domain-containing radical SAM protein, partial [Actinobacteria bacterium]|nr:B12-binding domain-containing radical SAM protein [Actinomycetota bacterium]
GENVKVLLISDTAALGLMEARPEPAWRVKLATLRNKDLLAPDYGAMHVVAHLKATGREVRVINLVADIHDSFELFHEPNTDPEAISGSRIGETGAANRSREYLLETLSGYKPDVVLVTLSIYNLALYTRRLLGEIKSECPGCQLVTGGIYSTFHPREILSDGHADVVVRGEGEITCAELLETMEAGNGLEGLPGISFREGASVFHNPERARISKLDSLPHPYTVSDEFNVKARFEILSRLSPDGDYIPGAGFLTSRGCPEECTFCLDPAINHRRVRFHSPEYVREVLDYCSGHFPGGAGSFFFGDATFTINRKRLARILGLLDGLPYSYQIQTRADYLDRATVDSLRDSGFTAVAIGAESFNEKVLRDVAKKRLKVETILDAARLVRRSGMNPVLTFIVGLPGETRRSVERTVDILKENKLYTATFFPLVVFKGTALFDVFSGSVSGEEMEATRLNPYSEEFLFTSDEFPTTEELTGFTGEVNKALLDARAATK